MARSPRQRRRPANSPFTPSTPNDKIDLRHDLLEGDRVTHDKHGLGRVVRVEDNEGVIVRFGDETLRRLSLADARLSKL